MFVFVLLLLPSALTAMPTIALFVDDNEGEVSIRSREAIVLTVHDTYWWFGKFDLFQAVCRHTIPPYSPVCGDVAVWAKGTISWDTGDFCSLGNAPAIIPGRCVYDTVVLGWESKCQLDTGLLRTETIARAGRSTPLPLARSSLIAR